MNEETKTGAHGAPSLSRETMESKDLAPYIQVKDLWKVFGRDPKRILQPKYRDMDKDEIQEKTGCIVGMREIDLEIKKGEFYIIMGLSGSGKSTLIRNIIRLVNPTSGKILIGNEDVTAMNEQTLLEFRRRTFGMVFQHYGLMPHMTVLENAAYGLKVRGLSKEDQHAKAVEALETVGLKGWEEYYPGSLSGGMQQRVGLARALANDPEILLMDEPFSGLDPLIRRQMQDELVELQDKLKKTIVFVTHDLHEALKLGDRINIMRNGKTVQIGSPEEIVTNPATEYVREFIQDASPSKVITAGRIMSDPKLLLYAWEGPKTALTILQKENRQGSFVVTKDHKLLGVCNQDQLKKHLDKPLVDTSARLGKPLVREVSSVLPDAVLEDLFSIITENPYPVPVVNEQGKLLGIVQTDDIFETITPTQEVEDNPMINTPEQGSGGSDV
jgi:glycine betaine/proline transport system ATP-binding protein